MKKWLIYSLLLVGALLVPTRTTELGKLKPVETVAIYREAGELVIETDTKDVGRGTNVETAIRNLKRTASGTIYLDTAKYLLIMEDGAPFVQYLSPHLKNSVRVCRGERGIDLTEAGVYLAVHRPTVKLKNYWNGTALELLKMVQGRMELQGK